MLLFVFLRFDPVEIIAVPFAMADPHTELANGAKDRSTADQIEMKKSETQGKGMLQPENMSFSPVVGLFSELLLLWPQRSSAHARPAISKGDQHKGTLLWRIRSTQEHPNSILWKYKTINQRKKRRTLAENDGRCVFATPQGQGKEPGRLVWRVRPREWRKRETQQ
jgi:hypothetical protein